MYGSADQMFWNEYRVVSSLVASRHTHDEMLQFSAANNIKPLIQVFKNEGTPTLRKIFEDLDSNKVRYRAVLEM